MKESNAPGARGRVTLLFEADQPGIGNLILFYFSSLKELENPDKEFVVNIVIEYESSFAV